MSERDKEKRDERDKEKKDGRETQRERETDREEWHSAKSFAAGLGESLCQDGLGFMTSITFILLVGIFMSSWLGSSLLALGEWLIKKMPLVSYIYAASKQISAAISPDQSSNVFKEVAIIRHPRIGEYAFGFITSNVILRRNTGDEEFCCVYVPSNHLYLGDIFLVNSNDIMRPNLSVRECIEIVISGGMSIPKILTTDDASIPTIRIGNFAP
ncbi:hypothetical protein TEA_027397 [Camellia sinensis var. sinensis]|uniref:Protein LIKE COV 3 n=1 Tax=Camellia sinensis var. sinensis TaxID=542762 RepID=A0A4S4E0C4_CAMSN|nr:hypothetical protein TEA_027397 [Camellia sinensis var. sinensis]